MPAPQDPEDTLISWQTNSCAPAEPPTNRAEWVEIIRKTAPLARVVLTTDGQGRWRVSVAEESAADTLGSGPMDITPIDHRAAVTRALSEANKRVRD